MIWSRSRETSIMPKKLFVTLQQNILDLSEKKEFWELSVKVDLTFLPPKKTYRRFPLDDFETRSFLCVSEHKNGKKPQNFEGIDESKVAFFAY